MNPTYLRLEVLRLFRNRQNFIFSVGLPLVLYLFIAGGNKNTELDGIAFPAYYLAGMIAFGGMTAAVSGGARIAFERELGWTRQLRISPLRPRDYLQTKVITSYVTVAITIAVIYLAAIGYDVRMPLARWLEMTGLLLIALIPFVAFGILLGHVITGDSLSPIMGGGMSLLSIAGGAFGPLGGNGSLVRDITKFVPSYWIVRAGHTSVGGAAWGVEGWVITAAWSAIMIYGAIWAYRRDT